VAEQPAPEALQANAYAIAFRLLGDRPAARAATLIAVEQVRSQGGLADPRWPALLAVATVHQCVGILATGRRPGPSDQGGPVDVEEGLRASIRRRLAAATDDEQAAVALHHLAGYDLHHVAVAMGRSLEEVATLAAVLDPPPGVSYRLLGDPEILGAGSGAGAAVRAPRRRWRPAVPGTTVALVGGILALVVAATVVVGARPTLGPVEPGRAEVRFGPDVRSAPSVGCRDDRGPAGTTHPSLESDGSTRSYRLDVPPPSAQPTDPAATTGASTPRGLLVVLPGYGQSADDFHTATGLADRAVAEGYLVATVDPAPPDRELNVAQDPLGPDDTLRTLDMVDEVLAQHCVDTHRVHAVGFGPGGQLAGALACIRPDGFATATSVSGALLPEPCRMEPPVAFQEIWANDDDVLPVAGGYGPGMASVTPTADQSRPPAAPAAEVLTRWGDLLRTGAPTTASLGDGVVTVVRTGGTGGSSVRSVTFPTGGHAWPDGGAALVLAFVREQARST
jgi:poly(3-hydroxybutyrate) depolymerase